MYEILFDCKNFTSILDSTLKNIQEHTKENFDTYVKNMWGYVQDNTRKEGIDFKRTFKDQLTILPKYSFIYLIDSLETYVHLSVDEELNRQITLNPGDLLIFETKDFIKDEFTSEDRIALVGSIALVGESIEPVKKVLI
jgi:alcohol dehydrogenase YqhD (iron-dependent ADH family)